MISLPPFLDRILNKRALSVAAAFSAKVAGTFLGLALNLILARLLGPAGIGVYFLALTITSIGATIARLGLDMAALRFASVAHSQGDLPSLAALYRRSLGLILGTGIIITIIGIIFAPYLPLGDSRSDEFHMVLRIMLIALIPLALNRLQGQFYKAIGLAGSATFIQTAILPLIMVTGSSIFLYLGHATIYNIAIIYCCSAFITVILTAFFWHRRHPGIWNTEGTFDTRTLLRTSLPLLWVASMSLIMNWTDILVLGFWTDTSTVGVYGVASRVAALTSFILIAVNAVTAPRFAAHNAKSDFIAMESLARKSTRFMTIFITPIVVLIMLFSDNILSIFGAEFSTGAKLLQILVLGQFFNVAVGTVGTILMMSGHEKVVRNNTAFAISINLAGNLILIPMYGAAGAAVSTAFSIIVQNSVLYWKVRKHIKINTLFLFPRIAHTRT